MRAYYVEVSLLYKPEMVWIKRKKLDIYAGPIWVYSIMHIRLLGNGRNDNNGRYHIYI